MKKNGYLFFLALFFILSIFGCRKDFEFEPLNHSLSFSQDTIFLDTVFNHTSTTVQRLKVYNKSNKNVSINRVTLTKGSSSNYQLIVDGQVGKQFSNVEILAKDSLIVFISAHLKNTDITTDYLYTDQINFQGQGITQKVELVTLAKDAILLSPQKTKEGKSEQIQINKDTKVTGFALTKEQLQLNSTKPYVIYGYAIIPEHKTLDISEGTTIYFHSKSGLIAQPSSNIIAKGSIDKPITMRSNRLEASQQYRAGLWGGIWLNKATNVTMENVVINNAYNSMYVDQVSKLKLSGVQIYNSSNLGLYAINSSIEATNSIFGTAQKASLILDESGSYNFIHCTLANFSNHPEQRALVITGTKEANFNSVHFSSSIIYGTTSNSLLIDQSLLQSNALSFQSNTIKDINNNQDIYSNTVVFNNNLILNNRQIANLKFEDPTKNKYAITDENIYIIGKADVEIAKKAPYDIVNKNRLKAPDYGAYQHVPSNK
ncbi:MAG: hypothetical protein LBI72_15195 [Flavobacteriaceae bacterium]|jgi:hypothetical protein|nr:hypothetical protein [Flavobacteriaceae bacterium]